MTHLRTHPRTAPLAFLLCVGMAFVLDVPNAIASMPGGQNSQQKPLPPASAGSPHRTRLILKDGSYQLVMSYTVVGNLVRYVSAERAGEVEEVPVSLLDFDATRRWDQQHNGASGEDAGGQPPAIDPELLKEEADRAALTPEVAPDLHLPEENSVLALDTFHATPELVPVPQSEGDLNHNTAHSVLRGVVNPLSSSHAIVQLKGETSSIQLHVADPVFYLRVADNSALPPTGGAPITVDTHGASTRAPSVPDGSSPNSTYVIVRTDVRTGARVIDSFRINLLGTGRQQPNLVETKAVLLPGGHWIKITPNESLEFGEFALMEVLSAKDVNLGVWAFGVHPVSPENADAIKPEPKRPSTLGRRQSNQ
jgi:hypothetical protein